MTKKIDLQSDPVAEKLLQIFAIVKINSKNILIGLVAIGILISITLYVSSTLDEKQSEIKLQYSALISDYKLLNGETTNLKSFVLDLIKESKLTLDKKNDLKLNIESNDFTSINTIMSEAKSGIKGNDSLIAGSYQILTDEIQIYEDNLNSINMIKSDIAKFSDTHSSDAISVQSKLFLVNIYINDKEYEKASIVLKDLTKSTDDEFILSSSYSFLGDIASYRNNLLDAEENYELAFKTAKIQKYKNQYRLNLARVLALKGDIELAFNIATEVLAGDDENKKYAEEMLAQYQYLMNR